MNNAFGNLTSLVLTAATANVRSRAEGRAAPVHFTAEDFEWNKKIVLIGSSTGGVDAIEQIIAGLPINCPPILITQHMPAGFLPSFAQQLNSRYGPRITLAEDGLQIQQGTIYLAPGGEYHLQISGGLRPSCKLLAAEKVSGHRPSVDMLFESAVPIAERIVSVILTGMGHDGARGMLALRRGGAVCMAQDEASSVVWGMPRIAWQNGGAQNLVALSDIPAEILGATERKPRPARNAT